MSDTTSFTTATMIAAFPEFSNSSLFPTAQLNFWLTLAMKVLDPNRWGDYFEAGVYLFTAHNVTLEVRAAQTAARGGVPGEMTGPVGSKSVGGASLSFDTGSAAVKDGAHWNLTTYGNRFLTLARMVGTGGLQMGYGPIPPWSGPAWYGPDWENF